MARAKNPSDPIPGVPWLQVLVAHSFIHGAAVALITGIWWLCFLEATIHGMTDYFKCKNKFSFNTDQYIHIGCKLFWSIIALGYVV